ncbi:hypothetical protein SeMB42_g03621 [Synchytrium endobioticum]|uniref:Uncharacterized protein n=1 Tax=Synchytrium endobioticum TaxID=286115 RepID=A0A507DEE4_9FUNG|nr:hypothetical protein SeMB42_g03621 [Synchytrium endobioticum]TPX49906.1 hypothetical protein SeLEV6574_g01209 [Synchytrium endobioticum]
MSGNRPRASTHTGVRPVSDIYFGSVSKPSEQESPIATPVKKIAAIMEGLNEAPAKESLALASISKADLMSGFNASKAHLGAGTQLS